MTTVVNPFETKTQTLYIIDAAASRFQIRAFAAGMLSAMGHNPAIAVRDFTGEVRFEPGTLDNASLRLRLKTASMWVTDQMREKDKREIEEKMHSDVLESKTFPEIVFESSNSTATRTSEGQYRVDLKGNLTLHGVTRSEPVLAYLTVTDNVLRARGDLSIRQSDYRIRPVSAIGGTLTLKDELKCSFEIVARRKRD
jgi:polyisoprenoid-binding protein YceI